MPELFNEECNRLTNVFIKLKYPPDLISNVRARVGTMSVSGEDTSKKLLRVSVPFKSQKSADVMKKQFKALSNKININLQPVFTSKKIEDTLRVT